MTNNVNCEPMRFVIRNLIDVDDVSLAMALEVPLTWLETGSVFPQRGRDDAVQLRQVFPSVVKPKYQSSRRTMQHYVNGTCTQRTNTCNPTRKRGCQFLLGKKIDKFV